MKRKVENNLPVDVYCGILMIRGDYCFRAFSGLFTFPRIYNKLTNRLALQGNKLVAHEISTKS